MATETRPEFKGKPVIEPPKIRAGFLTDEFGRVIHKEALDLALKEYKGANPLMHLIFNNGVVQGSNPFCVALVNQVLMPDSSRNLWTATPANIEETLRAGDILGIKGNNYVDTGLVLRSPEDSYDPNTPISKDLAEQLTNRLGRKLKLPVMIPLRYLDLKLDDNPYGLGFVLREDAEIIPASVLNTQGRFNSKDINPQTGLPAKLSHEGERTLYTREGGVSRLNVYSDLDLDSDWGNLGDSDEHGRVVVCGEVASAENLERVVNE